MKKLLKFPLPTVLVRLSECYEIEILLHKSVFINAKPDKDKKVENSKTNTMNVIDTFFFSRPVSFFRFPFSTLTLWELATVRGAAKL